MKNLEQKKRNFQSLNNFQEIQNKIISVINDLNKIIYNNDFTDLLNFSNNNNKININYNGDNIGKGNSDELSNIIKSNNKTLYENYIKNGDYDKLINSTKLAEKCSLYEDMFFFIKFRRKKFFG